MGTACAVFVLFVNASNMMGWQAFDTFTSLKECKERAVTIVRVSKDGKESPMIIQPVCLPNGTRP